MEKLLHPACLLNKKKAKIPTPGAPALPAARPTGQPHAAKPNSLKTRLQTCGTGTVLLKQTPLTAAEIYAASAWPWRSICHEKINPLLFPSKVTKAFAQTAEG